MSKMKKVKKLKAPKCIVCKGSGRSSKGGRCLPCRGTGQMTQTQGYFNLIRKIK